MLRRAKVIQICDKVASLQFARDDKSRQKQPGVVNANQSSVQHVYRYAAACCCFRNCRTARSEAPEPYGGARAAFESGGGKEGHRAGATTNAHR